MTDFLSLDTPSEAIMVVVAFFFFFLSFALMAKWAIQIFLAVYALLMLGAFCWLAYQIGEENIVGFTQVILASIGVGLFSSIVLLPFSAMLKMEERLVSLESAISVAKKEQSIPEKLELPSVAKMEESLVAVSNKTYSKKRSKKRA